MEARLPLAEPTQRLISSIKLHANSLIITIFGDAVLPRGGNIWLGSLIVLAEPFGLSERLVRTGVYRLSREGWLDAQAKGRRSYYTITASGLKTFAEADRRIYAVDPPSWDGAWRLVQVLPAVSQAKRQTLRRELKWLGFGQISPTLLAHPTADDAAVEATLDNLGLKDGVLAFHAHTIPFVTPGAIRSVAEDAWELSGLQADYDRFLKTFGWLAEHAGELHELSELDCFVVRTLLIHDYRRILLKDPQLPGDLLPNGWNGEAARQACARIYKAVAARADAHVSALMETYDGEMPAPGPAYKERLGGLPTI